MADPVGRMETMTEATVRLRDAGWIENWVADDGLLRCFACRTAHNPAEVTVDEVVRFEGPSDPGDQQILFALTGPCEHRGQFSAAYGPAVAAADAEILRVLSTRG